MNKNSFIAPRVLPEGRFLESSAALQKASARIFDFATEMMPTTDTADLFRFRKFDARVEQNIIARSALLYAHHKKWIEEVFALE